MYDMINPLIIFFIIFYNFQIVKKNTKSVEKGIRVITYISVSYMTITHQIKFIFMFNHIYKVINHMILNI